MGTLITSQSLIEMDKSHIQSRVIELKKKLNKDCVTRKLEINTKLVFKTNYLEVKVLLNSFDMIESHNDGNTVYQCIKYKVQSYIL